MPETETTLKASMTITRAERNGAWIERFCRVPSGPRKGDRVALTKAQKQLLADIYDHDDSPRSIAVDHDMGAYVVLLHVVGLEAPQGGAPDTLPDVTTDVWTLWAAASSPKLQIHLTRDGAGTVFCTALGTCYPRRAG